MTRHPRLVAASLLLVAFVTGGLAGMVVEESLGLDWFDFLDPDERPVEETMLRGLDLSPDQRAQIDRVLDQQEARLEQYWRERLPELRRIVEESYEEIGRLLTPDQRAIFDGRLEERGLPLPQAPD